MNNKTHMPRKHYSLVICIEGFNLEEFRFKSKEFADDFRSRAINGETLGGLIEYKFIGEVEEKIFKYHDED